MSRPLSSLQPGLFDFAGVTFLPNSVDGIGGGWGPAWTVAVGNTVTHPVPAVTSPVTQMKRTMYANDAVANRILGPALAGAADYQFWRGNVPGDDMYGGFYFAVQFTIEAWLNNTGRLFVGLASAAAGNVANVDTAGIVGDCVGLYHDTTEGANILNLVYRNNVTTSKNAITGATLAAGQGFLWEMWQEPNSSILATKLSSLTTGAKIFYTQISSLTTPRVNIFMAPQIHMANAANAGAGNFAIGVVSAYISQQRTRT